MTVVGIGVLAATVAIGVVLAAVAGALVDRAAARASADLAALAAAYAVREGLAGAGPEPCVTARETARANAARLIACHIYGDGSVQVTVASGTARASARAGPQVQSGQGPGGGSG